MIDNQFNKVVLCDKCGILYSVLYSKDYSFLYPIALSHKHSYPDHSVVVGDDIPHKIEFSICLWIHPEHRETVSKQLIDIAHKYSEKHEDMQQG